MGPIDWLILVFWVVTAVEIVLEVRKKRWTAAIISVAVFGLLTWLAVPRFGYLARVIASWF